MNMMAERQNPGDEKGKTQLKSIRPSMRPTACKDWPCPDEGTRLFKAG